MMFPSNVIAVAVAALVDLEILGQLLVPRLFQLGLILIFRPDG